MRCSVSCHVFFAAMAVVLAAPCRALDVAHTEIIGLRLGMPEADIIGALRRQGFAVTHSHAALTARTRDGQVTVDLDEDHQARRIGYVFAADGVAEPAKIQESVLDRFGPPDQSQPMTWCRATRPDGTCPEDRASLIFMPDKLMLLLRTGKLAR